jgi:WhiB family redox-sensing transcriptional regulator
MLIEGMKVKIFEHETYNVNSWREQAACKTVPTDDFYLERNSQQGFVNARKICANCPVHKECLDYAIRNNERYGIWGGMALRTRLKYKRQNRHLYS